MNLRDLTPEVTTHLQDVPEPTVRLYLRRAAKQFFQDSRIWDVNIGETGIDAPDDSDGDIEIDVPSVAPATDFQTPDQSVVNAISGVKLDDDDLDQDAYSYRHVDSKLVIRGDAITQGGTLKVSAVLEPSRTATSIPDSFGELWSEGIVDYCIWELMSMPRRAWSAPNIAQMYRQKYAMRVAEATEAKVRQGTTKGVGLPPIESWLY